MERSLGSLSGHAGIQDVDVSVQCRDIAACASALVQVLKAGIGAGVHSFSLHVSAGLLDDNTEAGIAALSAAILADGDMQCKLKDLSMESSFGCAFYRWHNRNAFHRLQGHFQTDS